MSGLPSQGDSPGQNLPDTTLLNVSRLRAAWNACFHTGVVTPWYDLFRVGFALLMLVNTSLWWPRVCDWFGETGRMPFAVSQSVAIPWATSLFEWLPRHDGTAVCLLACFQFVLVLLLLGIQVRCCAVLVYVLLVSFQHRNLLLWDAEDVVFRTLAFFLIWMPCGHYLNWRQWRGRSALDSDASINQAPQVPVWPLRLVQWQICIILFASGWSKLLSPDWVEGTALYYATRLEDLWGRFPVPHFLLTSGRLMACLGWGVMGWELFAPVLIWIREFRRPVLLLLLAFHLAIDYAMNLFLFQPLMLLCWTAFVEPREWAWLAERLPVGCRTRLFGQFPQFTSNA